MPKILITLLMLFSLIVSAQRIIENPTFRANSCLNFGIEKVVLLKDTTKLYMFYYHGGNFSIQGRSCIEANGKDLQVISSEGIELDWPDNYKQDGQKTHFVLNFPPLDSDVDRIDLIECYSDGCLRIFDIALTDRAAAEIKASRPAETIPDRLKNYTAKIKDNGKSLDQV